MFISVLSDSVLGSSGIMSQNNAFLKCRITCVKLGMFAFLKFFMMEGVQDIQMKLRNFKIAGLLSPHPSSPVFVLSIQWGHLSL